MRAEFLYSADTYDAASDRIEHGMLAESGPIWEIAKNVVAPYNDGLRTLVRTSRDAAA